MLINKVLFESKINTNYYSERCTASWEQTAPDIYRIIPAFITAIRAVWPMSVKIKPSTVTNYPRLLAPLSFQVFWESLHDIAMIGCREDHVDQ